MFDTVLVAGLGLMGGSMAKTIKARTLSRVLGWNRTRATAEQALADGSIDAIATDALFREVDLVIIGLYPQATVDWLLENMPKMKKLQQNRSRTCTANPDEYSLHRLHFPSSTGSAPSDPAHRPSAPFRHYKRRRSRSGQADDTPRLTVFHVSYDRHRDLPPNRRRTEKSQTDRPTRNIGTHEG